MKIITENKLSIPDSAFINYLRGICIFIIVFGHVGGFWFYRPYSGFLHASVPFFFFLSGAVSFYSYGRTPSLSVYYIKRIVNLLIPYYILCLLSLAVYIANHNQLPAFDINKLLSWITIGAPNAIMPFPIGQVWFLKVFLIITIFSPIYFYMRKHNIYMLVFISLAFILVTSTQVFSDTENLFKIYIVNFYKPLAFSSFYIFGILFFTSDKLRSDYKYLGGMTLFLIIISVLMVKYFDLNIDFTLHNFPPDIYYITVSFCVLSVLLMLRSFLVSVINRFKLTETFVLFFNKHTFSIYIIHTFSIYVSENIFGLVDPQEKDITYGIVKIGSVLIITCILSPPYSKLSNRVSLYILRFLDMILASRFQSSAQKRKCTDEA